MSAVLRVTLEVEERGRLANFRRGRLLKLRASLREYEYEEGKKRGNKTINN